MDADVLVVGAGAAGLASASALRRAGLHPLVLEARSRVGGRVWTRHSPGTPWAVELGAEFVHGEAPATRRRAEAAGLRLCAVAGSRWRSVDGSPQPARDLWPRLERVLERLDPERRPDRSFLAFLEAETTDLTEEDREIALGFVRGFHAAAPEDIGERGLAADPGGGMASRSARVVEGYDALLAPSRAELGEAVRTDTVVHELTWEPGTVRVRAAVREGEPEGGREAALEARATVLTLPVGVLAAEPPAEGAVTFRPPVPGLRQALRGLAMGSALRVTLRFRSRFWARTDLSEAAFLHTPDRPFNIWWTAHPLEAPFWVGWSGGPPAAALAAAGRDALAETAVSELARALHRPRGALERRVARVHVHDWDADPYSRGAYAYARVGGDGAAGRLVRPVEGTLFFAGEAAAAGGPTGTVEGALASGELAAREAIEALRA